MSDRSGRHRRTKGAWLRTSALLLGLLAAGCDGCEDDRRVPYGLDRPELDEDGPAGEGSVTPPFEPRVATSLQEGVRRQAIGEAELVVQEQEVELGAAFPVDLDGDGDMDVVTLLRGEREAVLAFARRTDEGFSMERLSSYLHPEGCEAGPSRIEQITAETIVAHQTHRCEEGEARLHWAMEVARRPRVWETIRTAPKSAEEGAPAVALRVEDRDADGHPDLVAAVRVAGAPEVELSWLDRPGGFSLEREQPAATLTSSLESAEEALEDDPRGAMEEAERTLTLFEALCRESESARFFLGDGAALQCGVDRLRQRVWATRAAAHARLGERVEALMAEAELRRSAGEPSERALAMIEAAWDGVEVAEGVAFRELGTIDTIEGRALPLASLWLREDGLYVRGPLVRRLPIGEGNEIGGAVVVDPGPPIRDPGGELAVLEVQRLCENVKATIAPLEDVTHPVGTLSRVTSPTIVGGADTDAASAEDRRCTEDPTPVEPPFEHTVLGWSPQGLLAARADGLRVIPLDLEARPAGEPQELSPNAALPAPLNGAMVTPDGEAYVLPSPYGALLFEPRRSNSPRILRARAWDEDEDAEIHALAIHPGGRMVAIHRGDRLWLATW